MKVLLTGASGFLGGAIRQMDTPWDLISIGRSATGFEGQDFVNMDLSRGIDTGKLPQQADVIIHLAQSRDYRNFPAGMPDMFAVNLRATAELLEYAREAGVQQFLFASTGSVYGNVPGAFQHEGVGLAPKEAYPATKYAGELLCNTYRNLFRVGVMRLFFLYGPGQKNMMIPRLVERIAAGQEVVLHGQNEGLHFCPTHVEDVARAFAAAIENDTDGTYNIASPEVISLHSAAEVIGQCLGVEPRYRLEPETPASIFAPNLERLREWYDVDSSFRSFSEGIAETIRSTELEQG